MCHAITHPQRFSWWREHLEPHTYPQVGVWRTFDAVNEPTGDGTVTIELTTITYIWFTAIKSIDFSALPPLSCTEVGQFSAALAVWDNFGLWYEHREASRALPVCLSLVPGGYHHHAGFL